MPVMPVMDSPSFAPAADVAPLRALLAALRRQARRWIWVESLAWLCLSGVAFFWVSLAIDWLVEPPRWVRAGLLAAAAVGLATLVFRQLYSRLSADLRDASLAVIVERTHPSFRDSLSTAIELASRPADDTNPALLARTATEAQAHLGQVRPERIFKRRQLVALAFAAALALASLIGLAVARPAVAGLWVRRMPLLSAEPWPRRVRLVIDDFPGGVRKVARGSDVDIIVHAAANDRLPEVVDLRWRAADAASMQRTSRTDRMGTRGGVTADGQSFGHVLKAVTDSLELEVRGGDARLRNLRLEVLEPPALEKLLITSTLPDYLGGRRRESPPARVVQIPRGSAVEIACTATKPLSAATMVTFDGGGTAGLATASEVVLATLPAAVAGDTPLPLTPDRTIVGRIAALDTDRTIVVRFTDADGLVNREPVTFTLSSLPDEPPQLTLKLRGISTAVTPRARIPLVGMISDDHGLAGAAVILKPAESAEIVLPLARVRTGAALVELPADAAEIVLLQPLGLTVGRKLTVAVTATDICALAGGPNISTSDAWSLDVVAPEVLVAMLEAREIVLRRRYESCVADLTQARDGFATRVVTGENAAEGDRAAEASGLGEATSRAAGEAAELAEAFRGIRLEFDNNQLLTPELEARLITQIADPLSVLAVQDLPALSTACRAGLAREELVRRADLVLARMRAVLDKMMELESFNEVVELLRGMIRSQEQIRTDTLEQQKRRAREALEKP